MQHQERFFVVTGGPGSGKTTLIEALVAKGLQAMPEAGRAVILHQTAIGGSALPWRNRVAFAEAMLGCDLRSFQDACDGGETVVFDRGLPDLVGYLTLCGLPVPAHICEAARSFRYNRHVFIAPPWPEIYRQDGERKQSAEEAHKTFDAMVRAYTDFGYELTHLPLAPAPDRVAFVLKRISGLRLT